MRFRPVAVGLIAICLMGAAKPALREIKPIAAGTYYPADRTQLEADLAKYFAEATAPEPPGRCVACIVPHAPYATSGAIAAAAFKHMKPGDYDRVIVLAPAHHSEFPGCSIPSAQIAITPLSVVPLDTPTIRVLDRSPLIEVRSLDYKQHAERAQLHEQESTVEVVLPFLQHQLKAFALVPMLVGDFENYGGTFSREKLDAVADIIRAQIDERTLIVVSSDFTHFGHNFRYRPFNEQIPENIEALDRKAFNLILARDIAGFEQYLTETQNTICGPNAILLMLRLLPRNAEGQLLSYDFSARITGQTKSSISYASIAFYAKEKTESRSDDSKSK